MSFTLWPVPAATPQPKPLVAGHQRPASTNLPSPSLGPQARNGAPRVPDSGVNVRQVEQQPLTLDAHPVTVPVGNTGNPLSSLHNPQDVTVRQLDLSASNGVGVNHMVAPPTTGQLGQQPAHRIPTGLGVPMAGAPRPTGPVVASPPWSR